LGVEHQSTRTQRGARIPALPHPWTPHQLHLVFESTVLQALTSNERAGLVAQLSILLLQGPYANSSWVFVIGGGTAMKAAADSPRRDRAVRGVKNRRGHDPTKNAAGQQRDSTPAPDQGVLVAPVAEDDGKRGTTRSRANRDGKRGTPQGSPTSLLMSNL